MNSSPGFRILLISLIISCGVVVLLLACGEDKPTKPKPVPDNPLVMSLMRGDWKTGSRPYDGLVSSKLLWHNPPAVRLDSVYDTASSAVIAPLRLVYRYYGIDIESGRTHRAAADPYTWKAIRLPANPEIDWNLVQNLVVRAKATDVAMYIDIGRISDDLDGDGIADNEDVNFDGYVDEEEDVGLDGIPNALEPGYAPSTYPDPSRDNWFFASGGFPEGICPLPVCQPEQFDDPNDPMYYDYLNGTEGNLRDIASLGEPDREQLTDDYFDIANGYFSYKINFATDSFAVPGSEYNGWITYQIPIQDSLALDTLVADQGLIPSWSQVRVIRVRFVSESVESEPPDTVVIADMHFEYRSIR